MVRCVQEMHRTKRVLYTEQQSKNKMGRQQKRVFSSDDGLATFVTVSMYKYLRENEISPENFRPAYFDHKKKKTGRISVHWEQYITGRQLLRFVDRNEGKLQEVWQEALYKRIPRISNSNIFTMHT